MPRCKKGIHEWLDQNDANKCCNPDYKRCIAYSVQDIPKIIPSNDIHLNSEGVWYYWMPMTVKNPLYKEEDPCQ